VSVVFVKYMFESIYFFLNNPVFHISDYSNSLVEERDRFLKVVSMQIFVERELISNFI
jgi:hypothetical protein